MKPQVLGAALLGFLVGLLISGWFFAPRYQLQGPADGGLWRLETRTGKIALCRPVVDDAQDTRLVQCNYDINAF
jgi:hypothetical protein